MKKIINENFSKNVIKYRHLRELSQEDLANDIDSYISVISNIENGNDCYLSTFLKLLIALDVTPNQLLSGAYDDYKYKNNISNSLKEVFNIYDINDEVSQKLILDLLNVLRSKNNINNK